MNNNIVYIYAKKGKKAKFCKNGAQRRAQAPSLHHFSKKEIAFILFDVVLKYNDQIVNLNFEKLGFIKIDKKISETNYKLLLPGIINIHPTFHILLLEPAPPGTNI